MEKYLFEFTVIYTKGFYDSHYLRYEIPGNDIPSETLSGIRLVSGEDYIDAYFNLESYIKNEFNLNDRDRFNIEIIDLNL